MGTQGRGDRRYRVARRGCLGVLAALLGFAAAPLVAGASSAGGPSIEAAGGYSGFYWSPASAEVGAGGAVAFKNASASVPHGVAWESGPATPSCSGVPINEGGTNWSGSYTFTQAGTYKFYCPVHPTEMTGTITVSSSGAVTTNPPSPTESPESPLNGPASRALKLARSQHGRLVRGSIELSQAAAGGRLEVGLLASRAELFATQRAGTIRVGRLVHSYLSVGRVSFAVPLKPAARRALRRHGRLALTVKLIVSPPRGEVLKLSRGVVVHG